MTIAQQIQAKIPSSGISYDEFNSLSDDFIHKTRVIPTLVNIKYWLTFQDGSLLKLVDLKGLLKVEE